MGMLNALEQKLALERATMMTILVATLGYFVDVFDLLLFSIVRIQSLKDLGVPESELLNSGVFLINLQMAGLLIGGILWGIWGDKMGRVSVLFGSILMYSLANIANGFITDINQYAALRFIAGIGLAGELGAGVTLASELLPRQWRGLGTTFIASIGVAGAVFAAIVADVFDWRTAYIIGGVMGLGLLFLRLQVRESAMFETMGKSKKRISKGNLLILLKPRLFTRYIAVILVGAPIWGVVGLFMTFTPEFAKDFGMIDIPTAGKAILFCYIGLVIGDILGGLLSQHLRSRKKSVFLFLCMMTVLTVMFAFGPHGSIKIYYAMCLAFGVASGYWAMFVQIGAEQFGTNIRATTATSIPNMVRGSVIVSTAAFHALIPGIGVTNAGVAVVLALILIAMLSLMTLKETFDRDLDYIEE